MGQNACAPRARIVVSTECEVDLVNAMTLRGSPERRFRAVGRAAEQDTIFWFHRLLPASVYGSFGRPTTSEVGDSIHSRYNTRLSSRLLPWIGSATFSRRPHTFPSKTSIPALQ